MCVSGWRSEGRGKGEGTLHNARVLDGYFDAFGEKLHLCTRLEAAAF